MQSNGKFGREMDLVEPKAAMRKFDRDMYDYPFDEQERHRTGESTFFDDVLNNDDYRHQKTTKLLYRAAVFVLKKMFPS